MMDLLPSNREPKELRPRAAFAAVIAVFMFGLLIARLHFFIQFGDLFIKKINMLQLRFEHQLLVRPNLPS